MKATHPKNSPSSKVKNFSLARILLMIVCMCSSMLHAQQISDIKTEQDEYMIRVSYSLSGISKQNIQVYVSYDNNPFQGPLKAISGDVQDVLPGERSMVWDVLNEPGFEALVSKNVRFKVELVNKPIVVEIKPTPKEDPIVPTAANEPELSTVRDIDGNVYKTVKIGNQIWMAENLRTSRYADGTTIPNVKNNDYWEELSTGAYCHYNNNTAYESIYGKLYNWYAVSDPSNLCPTGWHVPSELEWQQFEVFLGMHLDEIEINNAISEENRGLPANVGGKMKAESSFWLSPNQGATNSSGFSGLPGGIREWDFEAIGEGSGWWSSSEEKTDTAWARGLLYDISDVGRIDEFKDLGLYVRCIRN